jgi:hypothetical protein
MPLTCARCSAVNPDGNLYCQSCGTPLATARVATAPASGLGPPPAGPPSGAHPGPPPGFAPPAYGSARPYQSPYYAPYGTPVPVHRMSGTMIVAAVVALVVVLAGGGTALALIVNHNPNPTANSGTGDLPSPTPGVSPSPIASPTAAAGNGTESNDGVTIPLPSGWTVQAKDTETIILFDPSSSGQLTVASGLLNPTQTALDVKNMVDAYYKTTYSAQVCPGSTTHTGAFNGAPGNFWELCYNLTSGSSSLAVVNWAFAGANNSGTVYYIVMAETTPDNLQNFLNEAKPITQGLKWKLS